ncbi:hypothetical protein [Trichormus azollae]|jgi:transposase|uniref:Uncharacterized protein n=1 Tax=Nostoc azollae (strain 0708) TaxID=551115 RepID=D7DXH2_NOSA0|nr:hypothetical protein [Trichormus azollae]ADI64248.1 hypothetical protein Aazo_2269 ['Nostoc azollae' 0708]
MEKRLPPKLDREILKQLGTEQLVEIIIDQGKSIENLTNRVVELEKEIEKLKVSRDLETINIIHTTIGRHPHFEPLDHLFLHW